MQNDAGAFEDAGKACRYIGGPERFAAVERF